MKPLTYYVSATPDSQMFNEISKLYGERLQKFSPTQKRQEMANLIEMLPPNDFQPLSNSYVGRQIARLWQIYLPLPVGSQIQ